MSKKKKTKWIPISENPKEFQGWYMTRDSSYFRGVFMFDCNWELNGQTGIKYYWPIPINIPPWK